jgi:UDP-galactopyranose mutase
VAMAGDEAPEEVRRAALGLQHVSLRRVSLGIAREDITDKHWLHYPDEATVFQRVFAQGNASADCNPPGGFGITCEISYSKDKPLPATGNELIELCLRDCIRVGLLRDDDRVIATHEADIPYAYVVDDAARARNVKTIHQWLAMVDIVPAGRFGEWQHDGADHAFIAGRKAADTVKWMERKSAAAAE